MQFLIFYFSTSCTFLIPDDSPSSSNESSREFSYKQGILDIRSVSYLSYEIRTLLKSVLTNPSSSQQLFKIVDGKIINNDDNDNFDIYNINSDEGTNNYDNNDRNDDNDNDNSKSTPKRSKSPLKGPQQEQIWMIPVRTAQSVLGVLKIIVLIPLNKIYSKKFGESPGDIPPSPHPRVKKSPIPRVSFSPDVLSMNFQISIDENMRDRRDRILAAQSNFIYFSELFAPLLYSSIQIGKLKIKKHLKKKKENEEETVQESKFDYRSQGTENIKSFLFNCLKIVSTESISRTLQPSLPLFLNSDFSKIEKIIKKIFYEIAKTKIKNSGMRLGIFFPEKEKKNCSPIRKDEKKENTEINTGTKLNWYTSPSKSKEHSSQILNEKKISDISTKNIIKKNENDLKYKITNESENEFKNSSQINLFSSLDSRNKKKIELFVDTCTEKK